MQHALLEYRGSFRYPNLDALDRALGEVRDHLDDEDPSDPENAWMRYLWRHGMTLHVEAILPASADRHVAAAVVTALAREAIDGCVRVTCGATTLDAFDPADLD
jgi:hypothetical protein